MLDMYRKDFELFGRGTTRATLWALEWPGTGGRGLGRGGVGLSGCWRA